MLPSVAGMRCEGGRGRRVSHTWKSQRKLLVFLADAAESNRYPLLLAFFSLYQWVGCYPIHPTLEPKAAKKQQNVNVETLTCAVPKEHYKNLQESRPRNQFPDVPGGFALGLFYRPNVEVFRIKQVIIVDS